MTSTEPEKTPSPAPAATLPDLAKSPSPPPQDIAVLGLDFGTKTTVAAIGFHSDRLPFIVPNDLGNLTTPSVVGFNESGRAVGEAAATECTRRPADFCFDIKTKLLSPSPAAEIRLGEGRTFRAEQLAAMLFASVRGFALEHKTKRIPEARGELQDCVVALPGWAMTADGAKAAAAAVADAGRIAGMNVVAVASDVLCAAVCAVATHPPAAGSAARKVAFVDVGHAGCSCGVAEIAPGLIRFLGSASDCGAGSGSLDDRLADHVLRRWCDLKSVPRDAVSRRSLARLRAAVERAKTVLSTIAESKVEVEAFHEGIDLSFPVSRATVTDICAEDLARMRSVVSRALDAAGIADCSAVDAVEIVGGGLRSPLIQAAVGATMAERHWPAEKQLSRSLDSASSIATGAALVAQVVTARFPLQVKLEGADAMIVRPAPDAGMPAEEFLRCVAVEKELRAQDAARLERQSKRNELETLIVQMRGHCSDKAMAEVLADAERDALRKELTAAEDWMLESQSAETAAISARIEGLRKTIEATAPRMAKLLADKAEQRRKAAEEQAKAPPPHTDGSTAAKRTEQLRTKAQKIEDAVKKKEQGNKHFKDNATQEAMLRWTQAIALLESLAQEELVTPEEKKQVSDLKLALYVNLAIGLQKTGAAPHRIVENCEKALAIEPKYQKALFRRGQALATQKEWQKAIKDFQLCIELDPTNAQAKKELAMVQRSQQLEQQKAQAVAQKMMGAFGADD